MPRYAIYYTPPPFSRLAEFGAGILGYDCFHGADVAHAALPGIQPEILALITVQPRRYGFHATIVAPFELHGTSEAELGDAVAAFARAHAPQRCGPLTVGTIGTFVALLPERVNDGVAKLAEACVRAFNGHRKPMSSADRERRLLGGLTPHQVELMDRWGYPYVFDEFRFHMTLTGPVPREQLDGIKAGLTDAYRALSPHTIEIDALSLVKQDDRHQRFKVIARHRLRG